MREILASIDIGSSKIKLVVAEIFGDKINILCAMDTESRGVKRGVIVEEEETLYALNKILKKSEESLGVKISKAIVSVNEESAEFKIGIGEIELSKEEPEVTVSDIQQVLKRSVNNTVRNGYELVSVIPIMYMVDENKTRIPKGMKGSKLSLKSVVVSVPKRDIYSVARVLEKSGIEVIDIMIGSFASYYAHKNETFDSLTGVVIDLGHETMKVGIINKGIIINNLVLGLGGYNIDKDIGFVYKTNDKESNNIKENFALANKRNASQKETEVVMNTLGEKVEINKYEVSEVAMSRLQEMLSHAKNEINHLTKKEISYIIITGGLSEFKDFPLVVESVFGRIANVGNIMIVGARDNKYSECIGMINYFKDKLKMKEKDFSIFSQNEIDTLISPNGHKSSSGESILGKVFGIFFDN